MALTDRELEALFLDDESDRVERKASFTHPELVREAICAFANDLPDHRLPGVIFIGQHNDLTCANITVDDALLLKIGGIRSEGLILPLPMMHVSQRVIRGCAVAVVVVEPSDRPPVRLNGRTCVRVGPRKAIASAEEDRRLTERQLWRNLPFDSRPFDGATIDDLDLFRFEQEYVPASFSRQTLEENHRDVSQKLRGLRLLSPDGVPTAAALLLIGKNTRAFLPGAYIQFLRINGVSITDEIIDSKEISGSIQDQIKQIENIIAVNNKTKTVIKGERREEFEEFPYQAVQQLVRNAILHRNYDGSNSPVKVYWFSDRIEIHNPGGLFGEVTPETIWRGATAYRNPLLAEGLKHLGMVERFGFGLTKVTESVKALARISLRTDFVETFVAFILEKRS